LEFGYLWKWRTIGSKQFRFFILKSEALYYFEQTVCEMPAINSGRCCVAHSLIALWWWQPKTKEEVLALGSLPMAKCAFRTEGKDAASNTYKFRLVTPSKVFVLSADTVEDLQRV
jgi:hypothetical protein